LISLAACFLRRIAARNPRRYTAMAGASNRLGKLFTI
jgi:hypothetical protein